MIRLLANFRRPANALVMATAVTICLAAGTTPLLGQESEAPHRLSTPESLRGLDGVTVETVFTLDSHAYPASPTEESVRTFIESLLGDLAVGRPGPDGDSGRLAVLELDVGITTIVVEGKPLGWTYVLRLQVLQEVCVQGLNGPTGCSVMPTWGTGTLQPTIVSRDLSMTLYGQVADAVDRFLRDYVRANHA